MNLEMRVDSFKEPRGFIKILQWVFAICAFATTVNFSTDYGFTVSCGNATAPSVVLVKQVAEYPFELDHLSFEAAPCGTVNFLGNAKSDAEFFVTTGVLSFLYAMAAGAFYLFKEQTYQANNKLPLVDFAVTVVLAVFWLSGSAAWAKGVATLSGAADPESWQMDIGICKSPNTCSAFIAGHFSKLVISILFGFINFVLWAGNLWFLYKETTWFESIMKNTATSSSPGPMTP